MRFLLKARPNTDRLNQHIADGSFGPRLQQILSEVKPEAAYFTEEEGRRTAILIIDVQQVTDIPKVAEPFFFMGAEVFMHPVMSAEDLAKANIDELGKKWGGS